MIPEYPLFKMLTPEDKASIDSLCAGFPAYSDFNFLSLWSWNIAGDTEISQLNGNLVVKFRDYSNQKFAVSFLGKSSLNRTAQTLLVSDVSKQTNERGELKWIPEEVVAELDRSVFDINEQRSEFDYLFDVHDIAFLQGSRYKSKRRKADKFVNMYPGATFETCGFGEFCNFDELNIAAARLNQQMVSDVDHKALSRFFSTPPDVCANVQLAILRHQDTIIAFSIDEVTSDESAMAHFVRADRTKVGVNEYFNSRIADALASKGIVHWNWQQDLGVEGLASSKTSYRPSVFLKKHVVSLR